MCYSFFFFNDTATTEIYTLSLHDALPICQNIFPDRQMMLFAKDVLSRVPGGSIVYDVKCTQRLADRKSTRLNSSHLVISYAVFCLKKNIITSVLRLALSHHLTDPRLHICQ